MLSSKTTSFLFKMPISACFLQVPVWESNPDVAAKCQKGNWDMFNILEPHNSNIAEIPQDKWMQSPGSVLTAFLWENEQNPFLLCDSLPWSLKWEL